MNTLYSAQSSMSVKQRLEIFEPLLKKMKGAQSVEEKLKVLDESGWVKESLSHQSPIKDLISELNPEKELVVKSILAIGQGPLVFQGLNHQTLPDFHQMLDTLLRIEQFYQGLGGIVGYHVTVLKLIAEKESPEKKNSQDIRYLKPEGEDISKKTSKVREYIRSGILHLPEMAEIYPVGGAGDRLGLSDEATGIPLPAAELKFLGYTLLEGLLRDLEAREYLYYKLTGKRIWTPVAMMTSYEKDNHAHILTICESHQWFGRPKESFRFFTQPLVPVITIKGDWSISAPAKITLKPGGHGILWKAAMEAHIFDWLLSQNRSKILIRQINNPCAGIDDGLLAFAGVGFKENKVFGFASCPRLLNAHEGMDVAIETKSERGFDYRITNIEYTDFEIKHLQDLPEEAGSKYSVFPSNTNILFADIKEIQKTIEVCSIPGLLINMKTKTPALDMDGTPCLIEGGRLESTMQNIADYIVDRFPQQLPCLKEQKLKTYITFNLRRKTIAVTKTLYEAGKSILGTPEGALFDILENYRELLVNDCSFELPPLGTLEEYLKKGPAFFILLHPALGPAFSIIGQKIHFGKLSLGSELQVEVPEVEIRHLNLEGSLRILGGNIFREKSKCQLVNVEIKNQGIDRSVPQSYWKNKIKRKEEVCIFLKGRSEFFAENVKFEGPHQIQVPDGMRMIAFQDGDRVGFHLEKIEKESELWDYFFDQDHRIILKAKERQSRKG